MGYTNSNWRENKETCHLTLKYVFTLAGVPISWSSWRQSTIALLSTKVEYIAAAKATKELIWIACFFKKPKISCNVYLPVQLFFDSQGAIGFSKNPKNHKHTKYINIRHYYIQEKQKNRIITIYFLLMAKMIADGLTKLLLLVKFKQFFSQLWLTWPCSFISYFESANIFFGRGVILLLLFITSKGYVKIVLQSCEIFWKSLGYI